MIGVIVVQTWSYCGRFDLVRNFRFGMSRTSFDREVYTVFEKTGVNPLCWMGGTLFERDVWFVVEKAV